MFLSQPSTRVGLGVSGSMLPPPFPLRPEQASLFGSGVPLDSPLEGHSLWDLALITAGFARTDLCHFLSQLSPARPVNNRTTWAMTGALDVMSRHAQTLAAMTQISGRERVCWHVREPMQEPNAGVLHDPAGHAAHDAAQLPGLQLQDDIRAAAASNPGG